MIEIPDLVKTTWTTLQPFLPIIATKSAEEIGKTAVVKVWAAVEKKFEAKPATKGILDDLCKKPQDTDVQASFRYQLKKLLEEDNFFIGELSKLLEATGDEFKAQIVGNGAIAQGTNAKSVGAGGILIEGNMKGNFR